MKLLVSLGFRVNFTVVEPKENVNIVKEFANMGIDEVARYPRVLQFKRVNLLDIERRKHSDLRVEFESVVPTRVAGLAAIAEPSDDLVD